MKTMLQMFGLLTLALVLIFLLLLGCNTAMKVVDARWVQILFFVLTIILILCVFLVVMGIGLDVTNEDTGILVAFIFYFSLAYLLCFLFPFGARWIQDVFHPWLLILLVVMFSILSVLCFVIFFIVLTDPDQGGLSALLALIPFGVMIYCVVCTHPVVFERDGLYGLRQSHRVEVLLLPVYDSIVRYQLSAPLVEQPDSLAEKAVKPEVLLLYRDRKIFIASINGNIWGEYIPDIAQPDSSGTIDTETVRRLFGRYKKEQVQNIDSK